MGDFARWFRDKAECKRYEYDLNSESVVMDLGVYNGEFARLIYQKYGCNVYGFEPVPQFFCHACATLREFKKIKLFNYAVGGWSRSEYIYLDKDSTGIYNPNSIQKKELIEIRDIARVVDVLGLVSIDLIKINVEGCEYEIMESIIKNNLTRLFKNFQIQFHKCVPNCYEQRNKILDELLETHEVTWSYPFVWESFKRIK